MRKHWIFAIILTMLLCGQALGFASASVSVGVKKGDWIEYQVAFTGNSSFGHDVTWARIEVTAVEGNTVTIKITTMLSNGTLSYESPTELDLETGAIGDCFIIPANLNKGDTFLERNQGNITISGIEEKFEAGAQRSVISGTTPQTSYLWDKQTGVVIEANSIYPTYTITSRIDKTNLWESQMFGASSMLFYSLIGAIIAAVTFVAMFLALKKKKTRHLTVTRV